VLVNLDMDTIKHNSLELILDVVHRGVCSEVQQPLLYALDLKIDAKI
jgi:hypothetical protein